LIQLLQGDCLELMKETPNKSVDMILCDLPYGTTACKWDEIIPFDKLWEQYERIIKDKGAICLFGSEPFSSKLRMSNLKLYKYDWIWDKDQGGNFANAKRQPLKTYENIMVFNGNIYYPIMTVAEQKNIRPISDGAKVNITGMTQVHSKDYNPDIRYPKCILRYSTNMAECNKIHRLHPTQKPVALLEYLIKTYTNKSEIILDNCMGSGSTGVACVNLNRNFVGMELNEDYFNIAKERIENISKIA